MWKVLLVISAVVLGGAGYLSFDNKRIVEEKVVQLETANNTLAAREKSLAETKEELAALEQSIQMLDDETEKLETEKVSVDSMLVEAQSNLKVQESTLASKKDELATAQETIKDFPDIQSIQKQMVQIKTETEAAEIEVAQLEGAVAAAKVERDRLERVANELAALRADQSAGRIRGEFQTAVSKAFNKWGFVVIDGGNDQGVVDKAQLDVYRRGQPICKLLVTSVEPASSVADIIPGSLVPGQTVQEGDMVIKSSQTETKAAPVTGGSAAPAAGEAAQPAAPGEAPAAMDPAGAPDPFGGGAAPAPAGEPDPFGGGGMAPPAAAPAEPDPFGGAPAPPAEAPAEPDPFGN